MNVRILEKNNSTIRFVLEEVPLAFANTLRRIMLSEIPTLAIDSVDFVENSSTIFDEIIAHRLAMTPIVTDPETFSLPDQHNCPDPENGCPQCLITLVLDVHAKDKQIYAYSGDLKSPDPKTKVAAEKIPLTKLNPNQRLSLEANARVGIGKKHAKWQCASTVAYQYMPEVNIDPTRVTEESKKVVDACPQNIFIWQDGTLGTQNTLNCILCNSCVEVDTTGAVSIRGDERSFIFTLESTGAYPPEKIVELGFDILLQKIKEVKTQIL
ncbi:MAG: DNA-directed RNA polymerase subunit D [Candidatus Ranarchaeia archaeon]|jgi:DNA-directed RNA polymerase subunit D